MKRYTVQEYARLTGKTPYTIYKGKRYQQYTTVVNSIKYIEIPSDIDPLTLEPFNAVDNSVDYSSQPVDNSVDYPAEAASSPVEGRNFAQEIETLTAEKDQLQTRVDDLTATLAEKAELIAKQQRDMDALTIEKAEVIASLTADKRELQAQLDGMDRTLAAKDETITTLQQRIAYMEGQLQQQMEVVNRLTLPAPRKTLGERFKAALGIKPKTP